MLRTGVPRVGAAASTPPMSRAAAPAHRREAVSEAVPRGSLALASWMRNPRWGALLVAKPCTGGPNGNRRSSVPCPWTPRPPACMLLRPAPRSERVLVQGSSFVYSMAPSGFDVRLAAFTCARANGTSTTCRLPWACLFEDFVASRIVTCGLTGHMRPGQGQAPRHNPPASGNKFVCDFMSAMGLWCAA